MPHKYSNPKKPKALEFFREGMGYKRASTLLGCSQSIVKDWFRVFRNYAPDETLQPYAHIYPLEIRADALNFLSNGYSFRKTAEIIGCNPSTITAWKKKAVEINQDK